MTSLYRRILGPRFEELPGALQRFHDAPDGGKAHGTLAVTRASGLLRNRIASLMGLPKAAIGVAVRLEVVPTGDRERWIRTFPGRRVETVQWTRNNLLMERSGLVSFSCELRIEGQRLTYIFERAWFLGLRLPRRLSPRVESYADADESGWQLLVRVFAPGLGELVCYEGRIELE